MDEDVAGLTRMFAGGTTGRCTRCGSPSRRRRRGPRGARGAEHDALCERCYRSVIRDEQPADLPEEE